MSDYLVLHIIHHPQGVLKAASWRKLPPAVFCLWQPDICTRTHRTLFLLVCEAWKPVAAIPERSKFKINQCFTSLTGSLKPQNRRREQIGFSDIAGWSVSVKTAASQVKLLCVFFQVLERWTDSCSSCLLQPGGDDTCPQLLRMLSKLVF